MATVTIQVEPRYRWRPTRHAGSAVLPLTLIIYVSAALVAVLACL